MTAKAHIENETIEQAFIHPSIIKLSHAYNCKEHGLKRYLLKNILRMTQYRMENHTAQ